MRRGLAVPGYSSWKRGKPPRRITDDSINPAGGIRPIGSRARIALGARGRHLLPGRRARPIGHIPSIRRGSRKTGSRRQPRERWSRSVRSCPSVSFTARRPRSRRPQRAAQFGGRPRSGGHGFRAKPDPLTESNAGLLRRTPRRDYGEIRHNPRGRRDRIPASSCRPTSTRNASTRSRSTYTAGRTAYSPTPSVHSSRYWATNGYVVLAVNPRGSSTYGGILHESRPRRLGRRGLPRHNGVPLTNSASATTLDTDRLVVTGYSYGGFMSSWIIGHDDRFKAAVVGAPCTNLSSMYGTSDIGVRFGEVQWGGVRKDALDALPRTLAAHLRSQRPNADPAAARRGRRPLPDRAVRAVLRDPQAAGQGGRIRTLPRMLARLPANRTDPPYARRIPVPPAKLDERPYLIPQSEPEEKRNGHRRNNRRGPPSCSPSLALMWQINAQRRQAGRQDRQAGRQARSQDRQGGRQVGGQDRQGGNSDTGNEPKSLRFRTRTGAAQRRQQRSHRTDTHARRPLETDQMLLSASQLKALLRGSRDIRRRQRRDRRKRPHRTRRLQRAAARRPFSAS